MTRCMRKALISGAIGGGVTGFIAYVGARDTSWAPVKKIGLPIGIGIGIGLLAGFASKTSCEAGRLSPAFRGVGYIPRNLKCPKVPGISKGVWKRAIAVEMEHTNDREMAKCISAAHLRESPLYYTALAKMERSLKHG